MEKGWKGEANECRGESKWAIEVKLRPLPKWISGGMRQAIDYAERELRDWPVLVIGEPGKRREEALVIMRLFEWENLLDDEGQVDQG